MSNFESDELETVGYFLPEESQLRLKKLREYVEFLSHLAQPRTSDESREWMPEIRANEVAICLELLAGQLEGVLDDISWPANRDESETSPEADVEPEAAADVPDADDPYPFGMTLEQVDTLNRLIDMIRAHGDAVTASDNADFAHGTLAALGDAIFNDATTVREIIRQVESQRFGSARGPQIGVGEERAMYHAGQASLPMDSSAQETDTQKIKNWPWQNSGDYFAITFDRHVKVPTSVDLASVDLATCDGC